MIAVGVLAALALLLLAPLAVAAVRQRSLATMAARNVRRRRAEATLVVGGALLGTAIITSSFVVGDVVERSFADKARTQYGPIDIVVTPPAGTAPDDVVAAIEAARVEGIDGLLATTTSTMTLELARGDAGVPAVAAVELDLAAASDFGSDPRITGVAGAGALRADELVLNERTAGRLGARRGDVLRVHAHGGSAELTVAAVLDEVGLAGDGGAVLAPGTIAGLAAAGTTGAAPPRERLLVSLEGGVFDTRRRSDAAVADLRTALAGLPGVEVAAEKAAVLDDAAREGAEYTQLFATIGAFSVLAGLLLLVNLFVMLAEERKGELGMLRALGFTRRRLVRAFAIEGAAYALVAAALGAVVGIGIGWLVALLAARLVGIGDGGFPLAVEPLSLVTGAGAGLVISLATIWATSLRIARLNVIRAIRDLPEPRIDRARTRTLLLSSTGAVAGAALASAGYLGENAVALLLGVPMAAFSATPLLRRLLPERGARLVAAGTALAWGLGALPLFRDIVGAADTTAFVVQGVVLTAGGVSLAAALDRVWARAIARLGRGGRGLAPRLGVVYPLARPFRTSLLLGMFSLVVFTVTLIAAMSASFDRNSDAAAAEVAAGFDLVVDANPGNPIDPEALVAREDVDAVAGLVRGVATFEAEHLDGARDWAITGFDGDLLRRQAPTLMLRADAYATDEDALRAVLDDPTLAIVPDLFLVGSAGVSEVGIGETFAVVDPRTGERRELTVAGVYPDWIGAGALVGRALTAALLGPEDVVSRAYVAVAAGAEAGAVAAELDSAFAANGADASTFTPLVADAMQEQRGFMALAQGFLALGLLVGIAGLGVVIVRAVRERRQEIGVLRALGFRAGLVRAALLWEAGLIAVQGTLIGAILGLVTARQLLQGSESFGDGHLPFVIPWGALVAIVALPLAASLAASAWPASRAAALRPTVALRAAD